MDDWTKSTEGLNAKIKQLDTVLTMQKSKLAGLQAEYEKVVKEQGEGSEAARKLKVQINNQQAVVNSTEKEFQNYKQTLKDVEAGTIDLTQVSLKGGKAIGDMGKGAEEGSNGLSKLKGVAGVVGGAVLGLAGIVAGAVTSFFSLAESTRETRSILGKLETAFTTAGLSAEDSTKTYEELYGVLGDEGKANEAALHIASLSNSQEDLSKWTNIATGVYATFGDSLPIEALAEASNETSKTGQITGVLADALTWAGKSEEEFQASLDKCTTQQERQALIADTLNGIYDEASQKYKDVNGDVIDAQEAQAKLANTMAELGAIAEPIMTTLKLLVNDLLQAIKPFVELIGEGLTEAFNGSSDGAEKLANGIGGLLNALAERATQMLPTILNIILELLPMIASSILDMLPQVLDIILQLVTQIIEMLGTVLPQIVSKIIEIVPLLIESLVAAIPQLIQAAITFLMAIIQAIPTLIEQLLVALPTIITTIINGLVTAIPLLVQGAIQLLMAIIDAFPVIIEAIITNLPTIINAIIDGLLNALPILLEACIQLLMAIIDAIPIIIKMLIPVVPKIVKTIINALVERTPDLIQGAIQLLMGIIEAIPTIITELIKNIPDIIVTIVDGLLEGVSDMKDVGLDLLKGIWEGITGGAGWLKEKISGFAGDVAGWFKKTFKIESPSKLMADEVGLYVGEGIGEGVLDSLPYVKKDLSKFSNFVSDNLGGIKAGLNVDGTSNIYGTNGNGSTVVNAGMTVNYNGKLSRKQLKQIERDNYTNIKMKLRTEGAI